MRQPPSACRRSTRVAMPSNESLPSIAPFRRRFDHTFVTRATSPAWMTLPACVVSCGSSASRCSYRASSSACPRTSAPSGSAKQASSSKYLTTSIGSPELIAAVIFGSSSSGVRAVISISVSSAFPLFDGYRTYLFDRVRTMRKSQELRTDGMSVLQALADPVRLEIVRQLAGSRRGELVCGELAVPVTKATASHHIRTLVSARVIGEREDGRRKYLWLRRAELDERFPGLIAAVLRVT